MYTCISLSLSLCLPVLPVCLRLLRAKAAGQVDDEFIDGCKEVRYPKQASATAVCSVFVRLSVCPLSLSLFV